jgi:transcriptional regulator with XRE-family HTH domain
MNAMRRPVLQGADGGQVTPPKGERPTGFGALLRALRLGAGLSQEGLAERARLSVVTIGALERGRRSAPYPVTLAKLARALGLATEEGFRLEAAAARVARPRRRSSERATSHAETLPVWWPDPLPTFAVPAGYVLVIETAPSRA